MSTSSSSGGKLIRALGPLMATAIVIGTVIGSGIFKKPQTVAENVPWFGLAALVWVGAGVLARLGGVRQGAAGQFRRLRGEMDHVLREILLDGPQMGGVGGYEELVGGPFLPAVDAPLVVERTHLDVHGNLLRFRWANAIAR